MQTNAPIEDEAILIVAFGTTTEIGLAVYNRIEDEVRNIYPNIPVVWAFTSDVLRKNLIEAGTNAYSVNGALHHLDSQKIGRITVLPLYVVSGGAYTALRDELKVTLPLHNLRDYELASPLLHEARDADIVSDSLLSSLPDEDECPERVLFMGHGSSSVSGNAAYADVDDLLDRTYPGARLALLNGESFETLLAEWGDAHENEEVLLRPFFFTVGHHSLFDLSGSNPESWKSRLEAVGYTCKVEYISLGDLPEIRDLLMQHLDRARNALIGRVSTGN